MRLLRDEVYRIIAAAKGDLPVSPAEQESARESYSELINELTLQLQEQAPGDLSITHESVRLSLDRAYEEHRRRRTRG